MSESIAKPTNNPLSTLSDEDDEDLFASAYEVCFFSFFE